MPGEPGCKKIFLLCVSWVAILLVALEAVSNDCDDLKNGKAVFSAHQMMYEQEPDQIEKMTASDYYEYMLLKGMSLLKQGHIDQAMIWLRKAMTGGSLMARANLASALVLTGHFKDALGYQQDLIQDCDSPLLKLNYVAVLVQLEHFDEALSVLTEFETDDEITAASALTHKGRILLDLERYHETVAVLQKAQKRASALSALDRLENEANLGMALYFIGEYRKALPHLRRVADMDSPQVKACLGASLLFTGQYKEALSPLHEAESHILFAKSALGIALYKLGRFEEALRPLTEASEYGDKYASLYLSFIEKLNLTPTTSEP